MNAARQLHFSLLITALGIIDKPHRDIASYAILFILASTVVSTITSLFSNK